MKYSYLMLLLLAIFTGLVGCSGGSEYEPPELVEGNAINDVRSISSVVDGQSQSARPFEWGCEYSGTNPVVSDSGFESDNFIIVTPSSDPTDSDDMHLLATYSEIALEELLDLFSIEPSDIGIVDRESKLLVCSREIDAGASATFEGVLYYFSDASSASNPNGSYRKILQHELMHMLEKRLALRSTDASFKAEDVHRWFSEGIADFVVNWRPSSYNNVDHKLAEHGDNPLDDTLGHTETDYDLFVAAIDFLLSPESEGGAGNTHEDVIAMYQLMKTTSQGLDYHKNPNSLIYDLPPRFCGSNNEDNCRAEMLEYLGVEQTIFEYAFEQIFTKDGLPLSSQELRDNFYDGERWYESFLN